MRIICTAIFFDRLPNSTDTAFFRNFFKDAPEQELDVFYRAHNMVWDQSLALILYGKGPVYVDPRLVSHHRSIVAEGGTNYQSLYAKRDNKVSDARMYACQEDYIEHILHRRCTRFYKVRGLLFAEAFWIACKSKNKDDWEKVKEIWNQRHKKISAGILDYRLGVEYIQAENYKGINKAAEQK